MERHPEPALNMLGQLRLSWMDTSRYVERALCPRVHQTGTGQRKLGCPRDWSLKKLCFYSIIRISKLNLGLEHLGYNLSTGIFLYATNSTIDKTVNATEPDTRISDNLPDGWGYLGCNYDSPYRALKNLSWSGDGLSLERCAEYCVEYPYFGVESGRE